MAVDPRSPCIIGIGRTTYHRGGELAPEPLDMWEEVCRQAASDSGDSGVLAQADHLGVVFCQSWKYDDPTGRLADRLGCREAYQRYSGIGGVVAQALISDAAARMLAGEIELAILVGAEALDTVRRAYAQHIELEWSHSAGPVSLPFDYPPNEAEVSHELHNAYATFAIRDIARRGRLGVPPEHYREQLGSQLARCSTVAAHNPYAWFPTERSAQEIISPAPTNRMVAYPYTKYMTAVLEVDMAAAVILATEQRANELGIRRDGRIYLRSWSQADDPPYVAQHPDLWRSPAAAATSAEAIRLAGIRSLDEVDLFDLYSCFSASINFSRDAIGLELNDPRGDRDRRAPLPRRSVEQLHDARCRRDGLTVARRPRATWFDHGCRDAPFETQHRRIFRDARPCGRSTGPSGHTQCATGVDDRRSHGRTSDSGRLHGRPRSRRNQTGHSHMRRRSQGSLLRRVSRPRPVGGFRGRGVGQSSDRRVECKRPAKRVPAGSEGRRLEPTLRTQLGTDTTQ